MGSLKVGLLCPIFLLRVSMTNFRCRLDIRSCHCSTGGPFSLHGVPLAEDCACVQRSEVTAPTWLDSSWARPGPARPDFVKCLHIPELVQVHLTSSVISTDLLPLEEPLTSWAMMLYSGTRETSFFVLSSWVTSSPPKASSTAASFLSSS